MQIKKLSMPQPTQTRKLLIISEDTDKPLFKVPRLLQETLDSVSGSPRATKLKKRPGSTSPSMCCGSTLKKTGTYFLDVQENPSIEQFEVNKTKNPHYIKPTESYSSGHT